ARTIRLLRQSEALVKTNPEKRRTVLVVVNPDGSLGFAGRDEQLNTVEVNVQEGYEESRAMVPVHRLRETLEFFYAIGAEQAVIWYQPKGVAPAFWLEAKA